MTDIKETQAKAIETLKKLEQVLAQANEALAKSQELNGKAGLEPDAYLKYLESDRGPAAEKKKALEELAQWKADLERDVADAVAAVKSDSLPSRSSGPAGSSWSRI